mmetsp:Transcript_15502/g.46433  ORF Transcript_15502/g.46433 Transcript_15502/m.46433 type:complete len:437 (+) Transcript_15502:2688-3998(+)
MGELAERAGGTERGQVAHLLLDGQVGLGHLLGHVALRQRHRAQHVQQLGDAEERAAAHRGAAHHLRKALAVLEEDAAPEGAQVLVGTHRIVEVRTDQQHGGLGSTRLDAVQPVVDARDVTLGHVHHHQVDGAVTQEEAVRAVVHLLSGKVPAAELEPLVVLCVAQPQLDVRDVDAVRGHVRLCLAAREGLGAALLAHRHQRLEQGALAHVAGTHKHQLHAVALLGAAGQRTQVGERAGVTAGHHLARETLQLVAHAREVLQRGDVRQEAGQAAELVAADVEARQRQVAERLGQVADLVVSGQQHVDGAHLAHEGRHVLKEVVADVEVPQLLQRGELAREPVQLVVRHVQVHQVSEQVTGMQARQLAVDQHEPASTTAGVLVVHAVVHAVAVHRLGHLHQVLRGRTAQAVATVQIQAMQTGLPAGQVFQLARRAHRQ